MSRAPLQWVVATRSQGKLRELVPLLAASGVHAIGLSELGVAYHADEEGIECYDSFEMNALAKARYFARLTGRVVVADDSGLCVDALGGRPGVRSRRFARDLGLQNEGVSEDDANNAALLAACRDSGHASPWAARFVCAAAHVDADVESVRVGENRGVIVEQSDGTGGFGYDPYFRSSDLGRTFAAVGIDEKAHVSHRARAFAALLAHVRGASSLA